MSPIRLFVAAAILSLSALSAAGAEPAAPEPVRHALAQKKVGFYDVLLPEGYAAPDAAEKRWPICVLLHDEGSSEAEFEDLLPRLGRRGVIYVVPRAAHRAPGGRGSREAGWSVWPRFPESWGGWGSATFPKEEVERLKVERLATDWVADCVADVRRRYRADDERVVAIGHGQGATLAHLLAVHRPELVRAYFAYAGWYGRTTGDEVAAVTLRRHAVHPVLVHMNGDPRVEARETGQLAAYLEKHGVEHELDLFSGGSHGFTSKVTRAAQEFVARWCRGEKLPPLRGELVVTSVAEGSAAERIGLMAGDVLTSLNGRAVKNRDDLAAAMTSFAWGQETVAVTWRRGGADFEEKLPVGRLGATLEDR